MDVTWKPFHLAFGILTAVGLQSWVFVISYEAGAKLSLMCFFWLNERKQKKHLWKKPAVVLLDEPVSQ